MDARPEFPLPELDRGRVPQLVLDVLRTLRGVGKQAFLAGGSVRDLARLALGLIGPPDTRERWPADFDIATDALPEEMMKLFPRAIPTGIQHGTVTVIARATNAASSAGAQGVEEHKVELTTFRGEGPYLDGRRPSSISFLGDIEGDLARRDFTVNAMAWDPLAEGAEGLRDPFGGIADLRRQILRCVGEAHDRFAEDGLRPLRAVRFATTLRLALEIRTARAITGTLETFDKVARERVRDELDKLLSRGRPPSRGARLLLRTGLLARISQVLAASANQDHERWRRMLRALDASPADLVVRYAILLSPLGDQGAAAFCDQLKFPPKIRDRLMHLIRESGLDQSSAWSDGDVRRALARITPPELTALISIRLAFAHADGAPRRDDAMIERFKALLAAKPPLAIHQLALDGRSLMTALALPPGPQVGTLLRALLDAVLHDPSLNTIETLLRLASDLVRRQSTGNSQG
jgi:tRNA nucleotidyltransferase (CCA-adding enzyme)